MYLIAEILMNTMPFNPPRRIPSAHVLEVDWQYRQIQAIVSFGVEVA